MYFTVESYTMEPADPPSIRSLTVHGDKRNLLRKLTQGRTAAQPDFKTTFLRVCVSVAFLFSASAACVCPGTSAVTMSSKDIATIDKGTPLALFAFTSGTPPKLIREHAHASRSVLDAATGDRHTDHHAGLRYHQRIRVTGYAPTHSFHRPESHAREPDISCLRVCMEGDLTSGAWQR